MPSRPVFISATGQAGLLFVRFLPKGSVRNALAKGRFRDPPGSQPSSPHAVERVRHTSGGPARRARVVKAEPGPRKQPFACVPHADGFVGLLRCPRVRRWRPRSPFVRADARTFTRAVRPLRRGLAPSAFGKIRDPQTPTLSTRYEARHRCGPPRPVPRREDHRCALRVGTGPHNDSSPMGRKSRGKRGV